MMLYNLHTLHDYVGDNLKAIGLHATFITFVLIKDSVLYVSYYRYKLYGSFRNHFSFIFCL